jgi:hypothetical protein
MKIGSITRRSAFHGAVWSLAALLASHAAFAQVEHFVRIDVPGATTTRPTDINNLGVVVGRFDDADGVHGFILDHGVFATVNYPGAPLTTLLGINDAGDVVGRFATGGAEHGFVLSRGEYRVVDFPGAAQTQCHGINTQGDIVGRYLDVINPGNGGGGGRLHEHGFLYSNGAFTSVDYPDADTTDAWKISDSGIIIGDWSRNGALHSGSVRGYVLSGDQFASVDVPGALLAAAREANARGQMVGIWVDKKFRDHGFVRVAGSYGLFDFPGSSFTDGNAINDQGVVVGSYLDASGAEHGFSAALQRD